MVDVAGGELQHGADRDTEQQDEGARGAHVQGQVGVGEAAAKESGVFVVVEEVRGPSDRPGRHVHVVHRRPRTDGASRLIAWFGVLQAVGEIGWLAKSGQTAEMSQPVAAMRRQLATLANQRTR